MIDRTGFGPTARELRDDYSGRSLLEHPEDIVEGFVSADHDSQFTWDEFDGGGPMTSDLYGDGIRPRKSLPDDTSWDQIHYRI